MSIPYRQHTVVGAAEVAVGILNINNTHNTSSLYHRQVTGQWIIMNIGFRLRKAAEYRGIIPAAHRTRQHRQCRHSKSSSSHELGPGRPGRPRLNTAFTISLADRHRLGECLEVYHHHHHLHRWILLPAIKKIIKGAGIFTSQVQYR